MLENIVDILCVKFQPNRKGTPFQINTLTYYDDVKNSFSKKANAKPLRKWLGFAYSS